jgi:hypothetical protein
MFIAQQHLTRKLTQALAVLGAMAGLAWGGQTVAHASTLAIPDISEWQGNCRRARSQT